MFKDQGFEPGEAAFEDDRADVERGHAQVPVAGGPLDDGRSSGGSGSSGRPSSLIRR